MKNKNCLGMYIHIPFCIKKCYYCDFYSLPIGNKAYLDKYTQALVNEITIKSLAMPEVEIESIYLGGGTPSLLEVKQLAEILKAANKFKLLPGAEISMEANPATLTKDKLKGFKEAGINRISIGAQSFFDDELALMGRIHNSSAIMETVKLLHEDEWNFNLDLIYGLPGQKPEKWGKNLKEAVNCKPSHLSVYLLQLEEHTPMGEDVAAGRLMMLDDDVEWYMYNQAMEYLEQKGYKQYEISNFCLPGCECRHNMVYWTGRQYLGIGAGAVSYINRRRFVNEPQLQQYTDALLNREKWPVKQLEYMTEKDLVIDALILGLRLCNGINLTEFGNRFKVDITSRYKETIAHYMERGLLQIEDGYLKFTKEGYFLSNEVLCRFIA